MGDPRLRIPGPLGAVVRQPAEHISGVLRNLTTQVAHGVEQALNFSLNLTQSSAKVRKLLGDIYDSGNWPEPAGEGGNRTDPTPAKLPGRREKDAQRPTTTPGVGLKNPSLSLRLRDIQLSPDHTTLTFKGKARATVEIPTEYPPEFDTPTEIPVTITSTSLSTSQVGVHGYAVAYKVFRADFQLQLHYDTEALLKIVARMARAKTISRKALEDMLANISFDASAVAKAGIPLSFIKLSASSLLPLKRPLLGATDDVLPVQLATLPDRELFIGGLQTVPKGVFFDVAVPGLGLHYSKFGRSRGLSGTLAGLAKPDIAHLGQVNLFAFLDFHYAKRVSDAVDLNIGLTYTYSPGGGADQPKSLQEQYLHAASLSWRPASRENAPPGTDRSGHSVMFTVKGTFDAL